MSGYGTQLGIDALKGSDFAPTLTKPYLGPAKLLSGGFNEVGREIKYPVIQFTFECLADDVKGVRYEETIFEPDAGEDEKIEKMMSRVGYILQYFAGEETTLAAVNAAQSFENLGVNVGKALERTEDIWKDKVVKIKVLGSVYNSKARLGFPGYKGFIADSESAVPLVWSRRELSDIAEYLASLQAPPTESEEVEGSPVADANTF